MDACIHQPDTTGYAPYDACFVSVLNVENNPGSAARAVLPGDEAFQCANGNRIINAAAAAFDFARRAAHASANRSKRIRRTRNLVPVKVTPFGNGNHIAACIGAHGAALLTLDLSLPVFYVGHFSSKSLRRCHTSVRLVMYSKQGVASGFLLRRCDG